MAVIRTRPVWPRSSAAQGRGGDEGRGTREKHDSYFCQLEQLVSG